MAEFKITARHLSKIVHGVRPELVPRRHDDVRRRVRLRAGDWCGNHRQEQREQEVDDAVNPRAAPESRRK